MKIAIVGSSHIKSELQENSIRNEIEKILKNFVPSETTIVSGGAKGVDTIAGNVALINGFAYKPIFPIGFGTEANLARNLEIAKECDQLFCISTPVHNKKCYHHDKLEEHEKTAGCWTLKKALELNKPCRLIISN